MKLEINSKCADKTVKFMNGQVMMTPPIDENYWLFRVELHKDQAVIGFPKFLQIGIGMAQEEDRNTNLPSHCTATEITNHIKKNRKYKEVTDAMISVAVQMIIDEAKQHGFA